MATSQNGYPANNRSLIHNPSVAGTNIDFPGGIRKGAVSTVLLYVALQIHRRVENGGTGYGMWGYAERSIRGSSQTSNHASGTAIDWRAPDHALGKDNTFTDAQEREINRILSEVDHTVRWGGNYSGRLDEMHFEINAPLVKIEQVAARLLGSPAPKPSPVPKVDDDLADPATIRKIADETAATLIRYLLPNPYTANPADRMNVGDTLSWGTAHAARALDASNAVLARLDRIESAVGKLANAHGGSVDTEQVRAAIREAVSDSVAVEGALTLSAK